MTRLISTLAVAMALSLVGLSADAAKPAKADKAAARAAKKDAAGLAGKVTKIDGTNIVVQPRGKDAAEVTIATDANTTFEGGVKSLADLKPGMMIQASPGNGAATKIVARGGGKTGDKRDAANANRAAKRAARKAAAK